MPDRPDEFPSVVVAVATFRRPEMLQRALAGLVGEAASLGRPADILVVDNDPDKSAAAEIDRWVDQKVRYVHEPEPGISAARNRALMEAATADALVFIDDDEVPREGWLKKLVDSWLEWQCAAVAGPVESVFAEPPDAWVRSIGIFERRSRPSGTLLRGAASNNLLLDVRALRERNLRFDPRFGLSGGSDSLLTYSLSNSGGQIRWCDDAVVSEAVPSSRLAHGWIRRRILRSSNGWSRVQVVLSNGVVGRMHTRMLLGGRGLLMIGRGLARYCFGLLEGDLRRRCQGELDVISAAGIALTIFGVVRYEYRRRTHQDDDKHQPLRRPDQRLREPVPIRPTYQRLAP